ncbi:MAG: cohesin domain-containing protein, partial [Saprospiraceae bacterium]
WTATDACGNSSSCMQTITVVDNSPPTISCPADQNLTCTDSTEPANTGNATASDNCTNDADIEITFSDVSTQGSSGCSASTYSITRTWTATDACGNSSSCIQNITVSDTQSPVIVCLPNQTLSCFETVPTPITNAADFIAAGGIITDDCTTDLADFTVFVSNESNNGDNCPGNSRTITRTYYVQDACLNTSTCTQTFTYLESTQAPVITSILPTCYKYCASLNNPLEEDITYETDCSFGAEVSIEGPTVIGQANCPGTIYRYSYTVIDDCGRSSVPVTRDFIVGNDGPTINCPPFNLILECGNLNNQDYIDTHLGIASANTSCSSGYTLNYSPQNFNTLSCGSTTVVTFVATDDCGRTASCTTTISIQDTEAPVFTTIPSDNFNVVECADDLGSSFDFWVDYMESGLAAEDACDDNVSIQAIDTPFNSDCILGDAETLVTFIATDNCGNQASITKSFTVTTTTLSIVLAGEVSTPTEESVSNVAVTLNANNALTNMMETTEDGYYGFDNLTENQNYTITPSLNEDLLNGVSSYDLVLISKHILQMETLDSPYKIIAADVNNSGSITTMDLVALRKVILHIEDEFPNNSSWRFVPEDYTFPEPSNPFASIFPEEVYINGLQTTEQHNFVAVKTGDVNNTVVANDLAGSNSRHFEDQLIFEIEDREISAGETFEVTFSTSEFHHMSGYQFTLAFDQSNLDFVQVMNTDLPNLSDGNFGFSHLEKGLITSSWHHQNAISRQGSSDLFQLQFTATTSGKISDWIRIGSKKTTAEAYRSNNNSVELLDIQLRFNNNGLTKNEFQVIQNQPNPFFDETTIAFTMPQADEAEVSIYDTNWRKVKTVRGQFAKGYNEVTVSRNDLPGTGLFYYEVSSPFGRKILKMVVLK